MEDTNDGCFLQPHYLAFHHRGGARHAQQLPCQTSLAEEIALSKDRNDCFFPLFGKNGDFDLALLDVENSIRRLSLREDSLFLLVFGNGSAAVCFGEKRFGVEDGLSLTFHELFLFGR